MPTLTASYDPTLKAIVLAGTGFEFPNVVNVELTAPMTGTVERYSIGEFAGGVLDDNYFPVAESGEWKVEVFQSKTFQTGKASKLEPVAATTVTVP